MLVAYADADGDGRARGELVRLARECGGRIDRATASAAPRSRRPRPSRPRGRAARRRVGPRRGHTHCAHGGVEGSRARPAEAVLRSPRSAPGRVPGGCASAPPRRARRAGEGRRLRMAPASRRTTGRTSALRLRLRLARSPRGGPPRRGPPAAGAARDGGQPGAGAARRRRLRTFECGRRSVAGASDAECGTKPEERRRAERDGAGGRRSPSSTCERGSRAARAAGRAGRRRAARGTTRRAPGARRHATPADAGARPPPAPRGPRIRPAARATLVSNFWRAPPARRGARRPGAPARGPKFEIGRWTRRAASDARPRSREEIPRTRARPSARMFPPPRRAAGSSAARSVRPDRRPSVAGDPPARRANLAASAPPRRAPPAYGRPGPPRRGGGGDVETGQPTGGLRRSARRTSRTAARRPDGDRSPIDRGDGAPEGAPGKFDRVRRRGSPMAAALAARPPADAARCPGARLRCHLRACSARSKRPTRPTSGEAASSAAVGSAAEGGRWRSSLCTSFPRTTPSSASST